LVILKKNKGEKNAEFASISIRDTQGPSAQQYQLPLIKPWAAGLAIANSLTYRIYLKSFDQDFFILIRSALGLITCYYTA